MKALTLFSCLALLCLPASADTLQTPPADARHFVIHSGGGKHGDSWIWRTADGGWAGRDTFNLRGMATDTDLTGHAGTNGLPDRVVIRGTTPSGDAGETFTLADGKAEWKSPIDAGIATPESISNVASRYYLSLGGPTGATNAWFIETLLAQPGHRLPLLPSGEVRAEKLVSVEVGSSTTAQTVTAWAVSGLGNTPFPMWVDAKGHFFGTTMGLDWLPDAYLSDRPRLEDAQAKAMAARMPALAKSLVRVPAKPVAFTHVRTFDADNRIFLLDQTVIVQGERIVEAGPAAKVKVPAGAEVIDGKGKTLLPGLWDVHMHVGDDYTGLSELSLGVTSVRDPGNDDRLTADRRARIAKGELLSPNVYPSSLIDGRGPFTAQIANVATSEASAIELVQQAKQKGMVGVKFYGTFKPEWLQHAIAEAHRLGLHVHGHIPAGMRPMQAIDAGYDEITHINWIAMQGVPAEVLPQSNGILRFEGPGRHAKDFNLDAGPMKEIVDVMAARKIYSDPTMVAFEGIYVPENGEMSPSYAPFVGTLPSATERGFRAGGFKVPEGLTREDYRRSWAKLVELVGRMHRAGVPILAGTDGGGIELVHELEIYRQAGLSAADAIATATIVPARMLGVDGKTGSIAPGKLADLVLVEGDPSQRLGDLRQTRLVMLGGKMMDADALRSAAGFSGRPH